MSVYRLTSRALIIKDDKILLNEFNNGEYYNLPGGGVEDNETLKDAVVREVLEESGVTVNVKDMLYIFEYNPIRDNYTYGRRPALSHVFRCIVDESKELLNPTVIDSSSDGTKISTGCKWIHVDDLKNINLVPKINKIIIKDIKSNNFTTKFLENIHK